MVVTLRSETQPSNSAVTHVASSQVMSPIRAPDETYVASEGGTSGQNGDEVLANGQTADQATQRLAENVEFARVIAEGGRTNRPEEATLSHAQAEHLIRSLAGIPGGRPLIRVLLEGIAQQIPEAVGIPPPQPPSEPGSEGSSHAGNGGRPPREPRDPNNPYEAEPMLDNIFDGGRYDDHELAEYTKALRNSAPIQLPKLHAKSDYKAWRSEVPLHFDARSLGDITYGTERYDVDYGLRRPKYTEWYLARKNKAFSAMALSLSVDLRSTFKIDDIRDSMEAASVLWDEITKHFEAGDGINPDYLLRDLMMRMMQPNEKVDKYAEDIEVKVTKLRQAKGEFEEWQQASLLLSNYVLAFPDVTREYANWLNENDRKTLKLAEVLQRLRSAEHQRQQLALQSQPSVARPAAQVSQVTAAHSGGKGRKRSKQQRKKGKGVMDKKARTNCGNCGGDGHWWLECTETTGKPLKPELERRKKEKMRGRLPTTSLVNSVRVVQAIPDAETLQGLLTGGVQRAPSIAETVDLNGDAATSPIYSPTSPASNDEDTKQQEAQRPAIATAATPAGAETEVQRALQTLAKTALQGQSEGVTSSGALPTWDQILFNLGQGLKSASMSGSRLEPGHNQGGSRVGSSVPGDSYPIRHVEALGSQGQGHGSQMRSDDHFRSGREYYGPGYIEGRNLQQHELEFNYRGGNRSPPRGFGTNYRGRSRSPLRGNGPGYRGRSLSPPRQRLPPSPRGPPGRSSPPRFDGRRWGSARRGSPRNRNGPPPQQQRRGPPSHYGPPPPQQQQWRDGPRRGQGLQPNRGDNWNERRSPGREKFRGPRDGPHGRGHSPSRYDGRPDGRWQVNAVIGHTGMQQSQDSVVEWILDSGSQANVCGDLALFTTIREDTLSRLDFANGTTEHASIRGSVLLRVVNQVTGMMEDRLLDDVVYTPNAKVNIISLGYLQITGDYRFSCSTDQHTAWLSKLDTVLKFEMHERIYRLRAERVPGVMVMAALKQDMDSKKQMELLHQRFDHVAMDTVKRLAHKFDVGVKLNAKGLTSYECVACAEGKLKRMSHPRKPVRQVKPLETLMVDVCSLKPPTVGGASMFLFVVDEATRYKWVYLLRSKVEATFQLKILLNQLRTRLNQFKVVRLWSDQGGEFLTTALEEYSGEHGILQETTNSYSPQENGIVERANGIVLPRIRALLKATKLPYLLWGEALLHIVRTLNWLPTKPMGLVPPHQRLFGDAPSLDKMRVWGCIAHVRVPPESRTRRDKLESRSRLSLLLGYSAMTPGYKFIDLATAQVVTAQGGNVRFHEEFTANGTYVQQLLENAFLDGDHRLPETVPVARIKTSMETYLPEWDATSEELVQVDSSDVDISVTVPRSSGSLQEADSRVTAESVEPEQGVATPTVPAAEPAETTPAVSKATKKRRRRRARKREAEVEKETSGFELQPPPVESCLK